MSSQTFRVGEIAEIHGLVNMRDLNGMECEVIGGLDIYGVRPTHFHPFGEQFGYRVRVVDGRIGIAAPANLRKRRPPQDPAYVKFRDQLVREFAMGGPVNV